MECLDFGFLSGYICGLFAWPAYKLGGMAYDATKRMVKQWTV